MLKTILITSTVALAICSGSAMAANKTAQPVAKSASSATSTKAQGKKKKKGAVNRDGHHRGNSKAGIAPLVPATASASAPKTTDDALYTQQTRGSNMAACQQQAMQKGLQDIERKQFLATCIKGK